MLIKDLIDVPETVHKGDFVLHLTEGVNRAEQTLASYVVTPELRANFDDALSFIQSAVVDRSSKATYLDGSFGSGKSHLMAVLDLLLEGHPKARGMPDLAPVVSKHGPWMEGKRFLQVPYHMIAAKSIESAILGGYVDHVAKLKPGQPTPAVYLAGPLFENARRLRAQMGDDDFFVALNSAGAEAANDWGDFERVWNATSFEEATSAPPKDERRLRLVTDLVGSLLSAYSIAMRGQGEAYVSLDDGLSVISKHAKSLGYDAVILFLDELVLWLAGHASDSAFLTHQIDGAVKLIEAQSADRPVPIVSFVARQRDLRELVGEHVPGAEQLSYLDRLKHWEGRFHKIGLLDRNLPAIAEKRVLKPKNAEAKVRMDKAFEETAKVRQDVMEVLLTTEANRAMFRQVYPFSPALVTTLVAVSSLLQRERTAIKVMLQLLVNQRDTLELGDVVPVGDLFDVIAEGDEAFSEGMRRNFDNAKQLYNQKILPLLEDEHGLRLNDVREGRAEEVKARAFRNDDRLVKTLLLAALAPEVEPLKNLTAQRLAALNHGTIKSPIAGREGQMVLSKVRNWAARVGEIKVGEEANPTIAVQLSGVDTESILEKAQIADNTGERRRKVREIVFKDLGIDDRDDLFLRHEFLYRNTKRHCDVVFANVRDPDVPYESMRAKGENWRVVIDFPFDEEGYTPRDDLARIDGFRESQDPSRTLIWLPSFFSRESQRDLGTLVVLEHILAGDRFAGYSSHLIAADRAAAKSLLENQRSQLRTRVRQYLEAAYGVANPPPGSIDVSHAPADHVQSLDPTFRPQLPVGNNLGQAFQNLLEQQMLAHQYPAHPHFEAEVTRSAVSKLHAVLTEQEREGQRIPIEKNLRPLMRQIAVPLGLGEMGETHFVPGDRWRSHFLRKRAQDGEALTVAKMREWMDDPQPSGLPIWIQNLLIVCFAHAENLRFQKHGGPAEQVGIDAIPDEVVLVAMDLPSVDLWATAVDRAAAVFGLAHTKLLNASNVERLASEAKKLAESHRAECVALPTRLTERMRAFGIDPSGTPRMKTAESVAALVDAFGTAMQPTEIVRALAEATLETSPEAVGSSLKRAGTIVGGLEAIGWDVFDALRRLDDERKDRAEEILARCKAVFTSDEYASALLPTLKNLQHEGFQLLFPVTPPPQGKIFAKGSASGAGIGSVRREIEHLEKAMSENEGAVADLAWKVRTKDG